MNGYLIIISLVALVLGAVMGFFIKNYLATKEAEDKQNKANQLLNEAERKSTEVVKESQDRAIEIVQTAEKEAQSRRTEISRNEERLQGRSDQLDKRAEKIEDREHGISQRQSALDKRANKVEETLTEVANELEKVSLMTQAEAKDLLLERVEQEARNDMSRIVREIEAEAQEQGEYKARK